MIFQTTDIPRLLPELLLIALALMVLASDVLTRWPDDADGQALRTHDAADLVRMGLWMTLVMTLVQSRLLFTVPAPQNVIKFDSILQLLSTPQVIPKVIGDTLLQLLNNLQAAGPSDQAIMGVFATDTFTYVARILFITIALIVSYLLPDNEGLAHSAELYSLMLFATVGMCIMAAAQELILAYIALELSSISLYVLAGYLRNDQRSSEAGLKYFLFGAISSGILLYGMSLAYGLSASNAAAGNQSVVATLFTAVSQLATPGQAASPVLLLAVIFILGGLAYKIAAVPFYSWAPDVYQGAPASVTMLIATASKVAGFFLIYRLLTVGFPNAAGSAAPEQFGGWAGIIAGMALLTLLVGNIAALPQTNARRMLAYSGIGHSGFVLLALLLASSHQAGDSQMASNALLYYLISYALTGLVAFGTLSILNEQLGNDDFESLRGLWKRSPLLTGLLTLSLLSLAGIPPLAGFWAKLLVFLVAYHSGAIWLLAAALAMTVVGVAYYFRLIRLLWTGEPSEQGSISVRRSHTATLSIATALLLLLSLVPGIVLSAIEHMSQGVARIP